MKTNEELVRDMAYKFWKLDGEPSGNDLKHWFLAEFFVLNPRFLPTFHKNILDEIVRYRDYEWKFVTVFTFTIGALIGFILLRIDILKCDFIYIYAFQVVLIALVVGGICYTTYAHRGLAFHRYYLAQLEYLTNLESVRIIPLKREIKEHWEKGFFSHLFPFILSDILLLLFGIYVICHMLWILIVYGVILIVFFILFFKWHTVSLEKEIIKEEEKYKSMKIFFFITAIIFIIFLLPYILSWSCQTQLPSGLSIFPFEFQFLEISKIMV